MKKSLFITLLLCASFTAVWAQDQALGIEMGFARPILREGPAQQSGQKKIAYPNTTALNGLKVGLVYDATLIKGFGFRLGVNYTYGTHATKWTNESDFSTAQKVRNSYTIHTLEIPIDWQYKFAIAKQTYLILYTGPVFQYNFTFDHITTHKNELTQTVDVVKDKHYELDADGDGNPDYRPWNLNWSVGAGFQYKNYYIRGGYDFGIVNHFQDRIHSFDDPNKEYSNKGRFDEWSIRLGFYFWTL